jgi:hypothetical protein
LDMKPRTPFSSIWSVPRTGVEAVLTELGVAKSNRLYAVSSNKTVLHWVWAL